ncbi:hypothetical protein [Spirosoma profusum]|uniref:hypothetical protein n=1 Tax=Spirosoma profusum TaxID=2771354 RepID=UPI001683AA60|nr:hypothetical protein [Spirosoma profusum]
MRQRSRLDSPALGQLVSFRLTRESPRLENQKKAYLARNTDTRSAQVGKQKSMFST